MKQKDTIWYAKSLNANLINYPFIDTGFKDQSKLKDLDMKKYLYFLGNLCKLSTPRLCFGTF